MEWGDLATQARAAGELAPAWKAFIKTKFFVAILRSADDNPKNFLLHMLRNPDDGTATLVISEARERLDPQHGDGIVALSGADIICRIEEQGSILVMLNDGVFSISMKRVDWLRSGVEVTKARVVIRKQLRAAAPAAPMPVLKIVQASELAAVFEPEPETEPEARGSPQRTSLFKSRFFMPALLALVAIAVFTAIMMALTTAPAPPVFEAPLPAPKVATQAFFAPLPARPITTFVPADNSFRVDVPGLAEEEEMSPDQVSRAGNARTHVYRLLVDGWTYRMEAIDDLSTAAQDRSAEMDARQEEIVGKDGTLIRAAPVKLRGAAGREVRVRLQGGGERAARFAYLGSKFCLVMVTAPSSDGSAQIDVFLNSFQLN